jgi:hypothetical protein
MDTSSILLLDGASGKIKLTPKEVANQTFRSQLLRISKVNINTREQ